MNNWISSLLLGGLLAVAILGCQRESEYLHHLVDLRGPTQDFTHRVKELQGETRVDILWVIDNSGSMRTHQDAVIKNSDLFIQNFVKHRALDWKMGLISTSVADQPFVGFTFGDQLTLNTPSPVALFNQAVGKLGTSGDSTERSFAVAQKQLSTYPTFLRSQAILAVILVTDAAEQSNVPAPEFLQFLSQLKSGLERVVVYGVLGSEDFGCNPSTGGEERWNYAGSPYEAVINKTKGKVYKLCTTQFGQSLADLGQDLVTRIQSPSIRLSMRPVVSTIRVMHRGKSLPGGAKEDGGFWRYDFDLNALVFHDLDFAPDEDENVTVQFEAAPTVNTN